MEQRRRGYIPKGEKPTYDPVELIRRDMERAAPQDLLSVPRLIDRGRIAVSATTRRASVRWPDAKIATELSSEDIHDLGMSGYH